MAGTGNLANLKHFQPGNKAHRPSPYPERGLRLARRATVEAVQTAIRCMRDEEAAWPERLMACKLILAEGLPKKRDAFEALFAAAGADAFIEVRFVRPGERSDRADEPRPNGHDEQAATFRIEYDAGE